MRYPASHKQETRARILAAASRRFRARGYAATGVDEVMQAAGLTKGAFHAHFRSKKALLGEALGTSFAQMRQGLLAGLDEVEGPPLLRAVAGRYLSRTHRNQPAEGCALPALGAEVARGDKRSRLALQDYLQELIAALAPRIPRAPGLGSEDRLLATAALFAGAMMLARAVPDEALSERILRAARRLAVPELAEAAAAEEAARSGRAARGRSAARRPLKGKSTGRSRR